MDTESMETYFGRKTTNIVILSAIMILIILIFMEQLYNEYKKSTTEHFIDSSDKESMIKKMENADISKLSNMNYTDFKNTYKGADIVIYDDIKKLARDGKLTSEELRETIY
jgi:chromosomal replication initiation ATPase DnaA